MLKGTTDLRAVWPFEPVDLGPDLHAAVEPGTDVADYPRLTARLFYRNRDLAAIEDAYGSLEAMERATAEAPAKVLPHVLWLGLRHAEEWADAERVADLPGGAVWGLETQIAVARALAKALGSDADEAEAETRRQLAGEDADEEDRPQDPPAAVAAGA